MARFIITGEYKDKATKAAIKDLKGLTKQTSTFATMTKKYYAVATAAATYYSQRVLKESVRNALEDEKSQRVLALTLGNVANATDAAVFATEKQIAAMSAAYGVTDDLLRPALARLARSSGSASQAVYDLNLALDISAATGKSLEAVTGALGKALDGNYASLQRLGLGIDSNVLKTKDYNKIFGQLRSTFANFARNEANTTEGRLRRIGVAADEAKEIIGTALIDSINNLVAKQGDIEGLTKSFNNLAYAIGDTIRGITILTDKIAGLSKRFNVDLVQAIPVLGSYLRGLQNIGKQQRINLSIQRATTAQVISARNAEYVALKKLKEEEKGKGEETKKTLEQLMAEEAARKAGFKITEDIDSIQTVAAAKRLAEAREYKFQVLEAAQAQYDSLKTNYENLNKLWETQKTNWRIFQELVEKGLSVNVALKIAGVIPTGSNPPVGSQAPNFLPEPSPATAGAGPLYGGMQNVYGNPGGAPIVNVTVNAGAIGSEEFLVGEIGNAVTKYIRLGNTTAPAGFF